MSTYTLVGIGFLFLSVGMLIGFVVSLVVEAMATIDRYTEQEVNSVLSANKTLSVIQLFRQRALYKCKELGYTDKELDNIIKYYDLIEEELKQVTLFSIRQRKSKYTKDYPQFNIWDKAVEHAFVYEANRKREKNSKEK